MLAMAGLVEAGLDFSTEFKGFGIGFSPTNRNGTMA